MLGCPESIKSAMSFTNSVLGVSILGGVQSQEPPVIIKSNRPPAYWPSSSGPNNDQMF